MKRNMWETVKVNDIVQEKSSQMLYKVTGIYVDKDTIHLCATTDLNPDILDETTYKKYIIIFCTREEFEQHFTFVNSWTDWQPMHMAIHDFFGTLIEPDAQYRVNRTERKIEVEIKNRDLSFKSTITYDDPNSFHDCLTLCYYQVIKKIFLWQVDKITEDIRKVRAI